MKEISVHKNNEEIYKIILRSDFYDLPYYLDQFEIKDKKICIVTETNVAQYYLDQLYQMIKPLCKFITSYIFNEGEKQKNLITVNQLYKHLFINKFNRTDILISLGGGVVGDLTGYTAATFLRGIDFIQIPTSLLAQVDSSIGGKTGVDFHNYKNMIGAFHQPKMVYVNLATLSTLSVRQFNCGLAETIKHGIIKDATYFEWIQDNHKKITDRKLDFLFQLIINSCMIKKNIIELDPYEKGVRALLNYGHTLGHAIEKEQDFLFYHGECVAIGSILAAIISKNKRLISINDVKSIYNCFSLFQFPSLPKNVDISKIINATKNDKKMNANFIKFILLNKIGDAYIDISVTDYEMQLAIEELLDY